MVGVDPVDVRLALAPLEPVHVVLHRLVHVDRVLVDEDLGGEQVDLAQDPRPVRRRVDDHDVLRARPSAARPPRPGSSPSSSTSARRPPGGPCPPSPRNASRSSAGPGPEPVRRARTAARTPRTGGGRAARGGCPGRRRASSGRPPSTNSGWWITYWSTGRRRGHEDRDAHVAPAAGAAHLLPGAGDRARVARQHRDVEPPDVHPELQGVGAHDPEHLAVAQPALDRPALRRQVAGRGSRGSGCAARGPRAGVSRRFESMISTATRLLPNTTVWRPARRNGSAQRWASVSADPRAPGRRVQDRRIHEQEVLLARRRAVAVDRAASAGR